MDVTGAGNAFAVLARSRLKPRSEMSSISSSRWTPMSSGTLAFLDAEPLVFAGELVVLRLQTRNLDGVRSHLLPKHFPPIGKMILRPALHCGHPLKPLFQVPEVVLLSS
jgi:hypothetical protein